MKSNFQRLIALLSLLPLTLAAPAPTTCQKTKVLVLGAGLAGITAAQQLADHDIEDFIIVEYNDQIGGRLRSAQFGKNPQTGAPYTVELGANWVQGLGGDDGHPENPIWTLVKKHKIKTSTSDFEQMALFNGDGPADYTDKVKEWEDKYEQVAYRAGEMWVNNEQDRTFGAALRSVGWNAVNDKEKAAIEWLNMDWEYTFSPEESSQEMTTIVSFHSASWGGSANFDDRHTMLHFTNTLKKTNSSPTPAASATLSKPKLPSSSNQTTRASNSPPSSQT